MNCWTISEWGRLHHSEVGAEASSITGRLAAAARGSTAAGANGENVLEERRDCLRARHFVGVVAAEGCALEILPKIDGVGNPDDVERRGALRERLVHMLGVALDIDIAAGRITALGWQNQNLLEILIRLFADKLLHQVRLGLPRRYLETEDELPVLRGRLDVTRQFTRLAVRPDRLACRFDELSPNTPLNQIMKAAVMLLRGRTQSAESQRRLTELAFAYSDVDVVCSSALPWDRINLDRTNMRWRELVDLAKLLLGDRFQMTSLGKSKGFALLFDMNMLFESYVARLLRRCATPLGLDVVAQGGRLYCLAEADASGRRLFQTRPDVLVRRGNATVLVVDTKWKRISPRIEDPKRGVSQADVYQMMAYGRLYECPQLMLLYPHHAALGAQDGLQSVFEITGCSDQLSIASVNLSSNGACIDGLKILLASFQSGGSEPAPPDAAATLQLGM